ncbi:MAG: atsA 32 [Sphingobacteriaceae bacterium]|jgi:arylsulfatase A-like enzyme|nr:atsA 32 [Sphingobacteriaceae bacterium]
MKQILILFLAVCPFSTFAQSSVSRQPKQNVLFILIDDLGWTDVEPLGTTFYETPNIKKLAQESMVFKNAYAACPVCSPTRASIMTGKYPATTRITDIVGGAQPDEITAKSRQSSTRKKLPAAHETYLDLDEVTLAEAFKDAGYRTFIAGKWHLGKAEKYWPQYQGFDINKGGNSSGMPKSYFSPYGNTMLTDGPPGEHLPDRLANEAADFIDANNDKPFFAYLPFYSVHIPLQARKDLEEKYTAKRQRLGLTDEFGVEQQSKVRLVQSNATYAAMVEAMDSAVGKVVQKLKDANLYDNTIIVFFSDNGGLSTGEGYPTSNLPLRAGKGWLYEGGIREPLIIRWPGQTKAGSVNTNSVISTDFYPTLLEMTGNSQAINQNLDGKSFVPLLKGKKMDRGPLFWHFPHYGTHQGGVPGSAVIDGDWKLIRWYEDDNEELFNLRADISEKHNMIKEQPQVANELRQKLNTWLNETKAVLPAPSPFYKPN